MNVSRQLSTWAKTLALADEELPATADGYFMLVEGRDIEGQRDSGRRR
jgi:hypothetical protein